jgi:myo-inositol-1(or 4)-monophosphatase
MAGDTPLALAQLDRIPEPLHRSKASARGRGHQGAGERGLAWAPMSPDRPLATADEAGAMPVLDADWRGACRRMVEAQRELFASQPGIAERTEYAGRGEGGDRTLVIDRKAEDIVFSELERLHRETGAALQVVSEERGEVSFGDSGQAVQVIVDPIDGSLNARRTIPAHSLSIAVASGPSMADVEVGYVYDFGADEEFFARSGLGAWLGDTQLHAEGPGYGLEVVNIEAAKPERIVPMLEQLAGRAFRIRVLGSIALSLCYVAAGRFDGALTARGCRSVDAAVELPGYELAEARLDLGARYHVTAALDAEMLAELREVQAHAEAAEPLT